MPARTQQNYKPDTGGKEAGNCQNVNASPFCTVCNTNQSRYWCYQTDPCPGCNTNCTSCQTYCQVGWEYIKNDPDVGPYDDSICMAKDEFIFRNWTAEWWNDYQDDLLTADKMGKKESHNKGVQFPDGRAVADPENSPHPAGSLVTAKKYNEMVQALSLFSANIATVLGVADNGVGDVIRGTHAIALQTGYNNAKFKSSVCDICNATGFQHAACSCNNACSCYCACSCPCGSGS